MLRTDPVIPYAAARPAGDVPAGAGRVTSRRYALLALGLCVVCFLVVAPFLSRFEFSNGGENAVVASVQEIHRGGPWLVPTLHEEQRTKKPPLATWLSALSATPGTVARQSDPDPAVRDAAFRAFGWQVRAPALLAMSGVIAATYALGALVAGPRLGFMSALVCASSFFWIRNARMVTTDAHLALWVSVANALLAAAVLDRRRWLGLAGGGAALGLAMMSKGPVGLLQTVLPVVAFLVWRRWWWDSSGRSPDDAHADEPAGAGPTRPGGWLAPLLAGVLLFAAIGFTWYLVVFVNNPEVVQEWRRELTREGATGLPPSKWYAYVEIVIHLFPWGLFFVAGLIGALTLAARGAPDAADHDAEGARGGRIVLPLLMLLVPILVMSLFRDRELRYLIPLLAPASVVIAWAIIQVLVVRAHRRGTAALVLTLHWLPLLVVTVGLPLAASPIGPIKAMDGGGWYSLRAAVVAAEVFLLLVVAAAWYQWRRPVVAVAGGTAAIMVLWGVVLNAGYRHSREGRSEMRPLAEQILAAHADARVYSLRPDRPVRKAPIDLGIYLNRVIDNIADVSDMESTSGPRVLLIRYKAGQPAPSPPAGWAPFAEAPNDDSVWRAFTPPPEPPATTRASPPSPPG